MPDGSRMRTGCAGIAQLTRIARDQAADLRPTVPIPVIEDPGSGASTAVRPLPATGSGRAPGADTPPPCRGTPGRIAAAITLAAQAGDLEGAAALITGLAGDPARDDVVYALVLSSAMAAASRRGPP